ncbi:fasciclin domain-containing protein (plasmid) [Skermanella mucosa]|uniref:fasciclin domain-containing protein n=1 Tax=Skermanella mucosa TaxID=1789672 RepID=UPI00192B70BB|nr:fasciclin domain-containing protein [Skermanella mucosa]UEM24702.1 fasciclin domain-containing protein [Skermanella mucosa]
MEHELRYPAIAMIILAPVQAFAADLTATAAEAGRFDHFMTLVRGAGLEGELNAPGPRTVFMPTDAAFARLPPQSFRDLMAAGPEALRRIVRHHVVEGAALPSDDLPRTLHTADGGVLRVTWQRGDLTLFSDPRPIAGEAARVVLGDLEAGNAVVHGVDAVMLPMAALDVDPPAPDAAGTGQATAEPEVTVFEPEVTVIEPGATAIQPAETTGGGSVSPDEGSAETEFLTELPSRPEPVSRQEAPSEPPPREVAAADAARLTVDRLKDMAVTSSDGQSEGVVEHVVFSPETGEIRLILARFPGFFGLFGKTVAIPWERVRVAVGKPLLIADLSADEIGSAEEASLDSLGLN